MIWFTADTHFGHKMMATKLRGFKDVEEHDNFLIENWNDKIRPGDMVYHLGDFAFGKKEFIQKVRSRLNGKIHLILGGHDYKNGIHKMGNLFTSISDLKTIRFNHQKITLCHYSMRVWPGSHYNSYHLFGHSHCKLAPFGKSFDVGVDCWDLKPIDIYAVLDKLEELPDNFNLIKKKGKI